MFHLTVSATSVRAAGSLIKVVGDMRIEIVPAATLTNWEFGDVGMSNGFDGISLVDGAGNLGACGLFWDGGFSIAHGFAADGTVFLINTPHGTVNSFNHTTHSETAGVADADRPAATMHVQGCGDLRCTAIESVYARRGFVLDPGAGVDAAAIFMTDCIWGQTTQETVQLNPDIAANCHTVQFVGGYIDTGGMYVGASVKALYVSNVAFFGNTIRDAIRYAGASGATFSNIMFSGNNSNRCFYASANAKNFKLTGAFRNVAAQNVTGVLIDAGCDKYQVDMVGGEYCATPLSAPTNDATKHASVF